tara:strand:- start:2587 stop:2841 length:255 start_codon:yes stop_codon:yes gene_type:complete
MPIIVGGVDYPINKYKNKNKFPKQGDNVIFENELFKINHNNFIGGVSLSKITNKEGKVIERVQAHNMYYISQEELNKQEKLKKF